MLLAGAASALFAFCLASAPAAGAAQGTPVRVLSPHRGAVPARPVLIRLRLEHRARGLRVTLNGRSITAYFSRRRHGVRKLRVSPNHGLRYGRNVLRVSARRGTKGRRRTRTVRFRVRANRPLAAAGIDRVAAAGDRIRLVGTESKLHPSARRSGAKLRYRWSVVRAPGGRPGAAASAAKLRHPTSPTPVVIPGATGAFTLQLTVTAPDGEVGSDLVNVRADPPPSVWLETGAKQGNQYGVRLSGPISAFYPGDATKWLQIVVLKRKNLELVSNQSYDCPQATEHPFEDEEGARLVAPCVSQVQGDLAKLKEDPTHSYLAIAVNQPDPIPKQEPVGVMAALRGYVPPWEWWRSKGGLVYRGAFSAVFVPGLPELNTVYPAADSELKSEPPAMINDTLVRDNEGNYSLSPGERLEYDLHAPGTNGGQNVIAVGAKRFVQQTNGYGGFQVVVLDARTLQGKSAWFDTGKPELEAMAEMLRKATEIAGNIRNPTQLVFIASHGDPSADVTELVLPPLQNTLANEISRVGGTRGRFFAALNDKLPEHHSYALAGLGSEASGFGDEVLGPLSEGEGVSQAPLRGILGRTGDYYQWRVQSTGPPGLGTDPNRTAAATQLLDTVGQAPSQWPEQGNAGRTAAVKFIGMQVFGTDAPRTQYWTLPLPFQASKWEKFSDEIKAVKYPIGGPFSEEDFSWAQGELRQEIGWLIATHQYLEALAEPFGTTAWTSWAAFGKVATEIKEEVGLGSDDNAVANAEALAGFQYAISIGESIPVVGSAFKLAEATYEFAATEVRVGGEPAADPFRVKVADAAEQLVKRLEATETLLRRQVPDAIASDYARLKTVGACGAASVRERAGCPWNAEAWQLTQDDQEAVGRALLKAARVGAYSTFLPARYTAWSLPASPYRKASTYAGFTSTGCHWPFKYLPASGQQISPIYALAADPAFQIRALGYETGTGALGKEWSMHVPAASVTDELFGTGKGSLRVNAEEFFNRSFFLQDESPLSHYPEADSDTGWLKICGPKALSGRPLSAPPRASLGAAAHKGIPVSFDVPREGSTVRLTLSLGRAVPRRSAKPGAALRDGSVLAELMQRNRSAGNYSARIRIARSLARRVRSTRFRRATLRLTVFGQHGRKSAAKSSLVLLP